MRRGVMWRTVFIALALLVSVPGMASDSLKVAFWNLENFFDWRDGGEGESDSEFSSRGSRHWTRKRFEAKAAGIAKTILRMGDEYGGVPDVMGFAEVENAFVVKYLCQETVLRKLGYRYVHFDSPDPRGIDCALIYRPDRVRLLHSFAYAIDSLKTRDILMCRFLTGSSDTLTVFVNHHPSKYGGDISDANRAIAVRRLCELTDSLASGPGSGIIALGDFNDTPDNQAYAPLRERYTSLALPLAAAGEGTIKFNGEWELIDQAYASSRLDATMHICRAPHLLEPDRAHTGFKPLRTYSGPRHLGGLSDHLPILVICP